MAWNSDDSLIITAQTDFLIKIWNTKDVELIPMSEDTNSYFEREVKPFVPDYILEFEENLAGKAISIKTGAEFPFTRYFYEYQAPEKSEILLKEFQGVSAELAESANTAYTKILKEINDDILVVARVCGPLTYWNCREAIKKKVELNDDFSEFGLDEMFTSYFTFRFVGNFLINENFLS